MTTLITAAPQGRSRRSIAHCPEPRIRPRTSAPDQGCSWQAIRLLPLDDALVICLAVLDETPDSFQQAAAVWHARWCTFSPSLTLAYAHVALDALQALPGPAPAEGARSLRAVRAPRPRRGCRGPRRVAPGRDGERGTRQRVLARSAMSSLTTSSTAK